MYVVYLLAWVDRITSKKHQGRKIELRQDILIYYFIVEYFFLIIYICKRNITI